MSLNQKLYIDYCVSTVSLQIHFEQVDIALKEN